MKADFISYLNELIHRKYRKAQPQSRTRMTWITRIFTDTQNTASGASVSAFIRVHLRFLKNVVIQTGLTGSTRDVFDFVHPFIPSNLKYQYQRPSEERE
jgi:hypothetical protein